MSPYETLPPHILAFIVALAGLFVVCVTLAAHMLSAYRRRRALDDAVSPVIAVILMVAITVVLAATVYVWVSGFGAQGEQAGNLALSQSTSLVTNDASAVTACTAGATWCARWTISSASPGFRGTDLRVTDATTSVGTITCLQNGAALTTTPLAAGDTLACYGTGADPAVGDHINFIDTPAGTVVATLTLR